MVLKGVGFSGSVDVYETDGQFVCSFGEQILSRPSGITVNDGRVMVVDTCGVHIFSEQGEPLNRFDLQGSSKQRNIAFHRESQQIVKVGLSFRPSLLKIEIYTKDGEFVRSTSIHLEKQFSINGITVTTEGRIAVAVLFEDISHQIIII